MALRDAELVDQRDQLLGVVRRDVLRLLARAHLLLEGGGAQRVVLQLDAAAAARHDQEHVLEGDPGDVLEPAPLAGDQHAVDRLRPEHAAEEMIGGDHRGGRNQHAPVAIEREKRQRAEDVEMRFEAPAAEVNQQRAHQHLRAGDRVARRRLAGTKHGERRGEQADRAAEENGRPDVHVRAADRAVPGERRHPQREHDPGEPLEAHQPGEQPIGALVNLAPGLREQFHRAGVDGELDVERLGHGGKAGSRHAGRAPIGAAARQQGDQRELAGVLARVGARAGDAAAEDQLASAVVEERLPGCLHPEPPRLHAVIVSHDGDVGQRRGAAPQIGLLPAALERRRPQEQHVGLRMLRRAGEHFGEFLDAGARAGALRMDDEQQGRALARRHQRAVSGPSLRCVGRGARLVLVRPDHPQPGRHPHDPHGRQSPQPAVAFVSVHRVQYRRIKCNTLARRAGEHETGVKTMSQNELRKEGPGWRHTAEV